MWVFRSAFVFRCVDFTSWKIISSFHFIRIISYRINSERASKISARVGEIERFWRRETMLLTPQRKWTAGKFVKLSKKINVATYQRQAVTVKNILMRFFRGQLSIAFPLVFLFLGYLGHQKNRIMFGPHFGVDFDLNNFCSAFFLVLTERHEKRLLPAPCRHFRSMQNHQECANWLSITINYLWIQQSSTKLDSLG